MNGVRPTTQDQADLMIRALRYTDPVVRALESELQQEYVERYGLTDENHTAPDEFAPPAGAFLVGFLGNEPVATGGFRRHEDGIAEIKRMYVSHDHRGGGLARRLLVELEAQAALAGYRRVVLETGNRQPEAISLYTSSGYEPVSGFGRYADAEFAYHFGKDLTVVPGDVAPDGTLSDDADPRAGDLLPEGDR